MLLTPRLPTLTTPRLTLRPWETHDLPDFAALNADPEVMRHFPQPLSRAESDAFVDRIRLHSEAHGFGFWAVEAPGHPASFVGLVGLAAPRFQARFTPCVEIGWRLARAHWGRGYATEAASRALAYGFDVLRLPEIVAFTAVGNERSRAVMRRLGMRRDPADDFDHPNLPAGHTLQRHVLYRLSADAWGACRAAAGTRRASPMPP